MNRIAMYTHQVGKLVRLELISRDPTLRSGVRNVTESLGSGWILDEYLNAGEALSHIRLTAPQIAFIDASLSDLSHLECTQKIRTLVPGLHVILSGSGDFQDVFTSFVA